MGRKIMPYQLCFLVYIVDFYGCNKPKYIFQMNIKFTYIWKHVSKMTSYHILVFLVTTYTTNQW